MRNHLRSVLDLLLPVVATFRVVDLGHSCVLDFRQM